MLSNSFSYDEKKVFLYEEGIIMNSSEESSENKKQVNVNIQSFSDDNFEQSKLAYDTNKLKIITQQIGTMVTLNDTAIADEFGCKYQIEYNKEKFYGIGQNNIRLFEYRNKGKPYVGKIFYLEPDSSILCKRCMSFKHKNISKVYCLYELNKEVNGQYYKFTLALLEIVQYRDYKYFMGGVLGNHLPGLINFKIINLPECIYKHIIKQLLKCLEYIHSAGFCHMNIKPGNILFSNIFSIKLSDFSNILSLYNTMKENKSELKKTNHHMVTVQDEFIRDESKKDQYIIIKGSKYYHSPEFYLQWIKKNNRIKYDKYTMFKQDLFGLGATLFSFLYRIKANEDKYIYNKKKLDSYENDYSKYKTVEETKKVIISCLNESFELLNKPNNENDDNNTDKSMQKSTKLQSYTYNNYSSSIKNFIKGLIEPDVNKRLNLYEAINHRWIKNTNDDDIELKKLQRINQNEKCNINIVETCKIRTYCNIKSKARKRKLINLNNYT